MDAQRWERIQDLFHRAADLPAAEQQSLLAAECAEDPEMVAEVTALLRGRQIRRAVEEVLNAFPA
jgi:hypothetical protein